MDAGNGNEQWEHFCSLRRHVEVIEDKICEEFHTNEPSLAKLKDLAQEGNRVLKQLLAMELTAIQKDIEGLLGGQLQEFDDLKKDPQALKNKTAEELVNAGTLAQPIFEAAVEKLRKLVNLPSRAVVMGPMKLPYRICEKMEELKMDGKHPCAVFDVNRATLQVLGSKQWTQVLMAFVTCFGKVMKMKNKFDVAFEAMKEPPCLFYQMELRDTLDCVEGGKGWVVELQITTRQIVKLKEQFHVMYEVTRVNQLPKNCVACHKPAGPISAALAAPAPGLAAAPAPAPVPVFAAAAAPAPVLAAFTPTPVFAALPVLAPVIPGVSPVAAPPVAAAASPVAAAASPVATAASPMPCTMLCVTPSNILSYSDSKWDVLCSRNGNRRFGAASHQGKVYVMSNQGSASFELRLKTWSSLPTMSIRRIGFGMCSHGGKIYTIGGTECGEQLESFDLRTSIWTVVSSMKQSIRECGIVGMDRFLYVGGGLTSVGVERSASRFDLAAGRWESLPALRTARSGLTLAVFQNQIYAVGGCRGTTYFAAVERLNAAENQWENMPEMKHARAECGVCVYGNCLYVAGGHNAAPLTAVECFNPSMGVWVPVADLPNPASSCFLVLKQG